MSGKKNTYANFHEDIIQKATEIYLELRVGSLREVNKKRAMCFCIYQVYLDMGKPKDIIMIGRKLGLDDKDSDSCYTDYSKKLAQNSEGVTVPHYFGVIYPDQLIRAYCDEEHFNLTQECIDEIINMWEIIKTPELEERRTRTLVAGIIYLYFTIKCVPIGESFYKMFGLTKPTVINIYNALNNAKNNT